MVVTTKQPKPSIPVVPSRTGSATATPKAAKRANLNVQPATSIPSRSLQEDQPIPGAARIPTTTPSLSSKHETSGPFSDNARFLVSPLYSETAQTMLTHTCLIAFAKEINQKTS